MKLFLLTRFSGECCLSFGLASAVYHSGCIRRFLLHSTPLKVEFKETEQSAHEVAFDCLISRISDDLFVHKKAFLMSRILEI
jgi:hypothetical protein